MELIREVTYCFPSKLAHQFGHRSLWRCQEFQWQEKSLPNPIFCPLAAENSNQKLQAIFLTNQICKKYQQIRRVHSHPHLNFQKQLLQKLSAHELPMKQLTEDPGAQVHQQVSHQSRRPHHLQQRADQIHNKIKFKKYTQTFKSVLVIGK